MEAPLALVTPIAAHLKHMWQTACEVESKQATKCVMTIKVATCSAASARHVTYSQTPTLAAIV